MRRTSFHLFVATMLSLLCHSSFAASSNLKEYLVAESGFAIALPSQPQLKLIQNSNGDGSLRKYQSFEPTHKELFSIFVSKPEQRGIFEPESMDAFLDGHIKSMVKTAEKGKLLFSRRVKFHSHPALEYQFSHWIDDQPYLAQGVIFMIDGGYMRLSMWHPTDEPTANADLKRFLGSFKLTPIAYRASVDTFHDQRGITFTPPEGWVQVPVRNAIQVAHFSNLTRSIFVSAVGSSAYTCENLRIEIQKSGRLKNASTVMLAGQKFSKFMSFENVPKYNIRLTTVHYCLDSRLGAVFLSASEEESMFSRWAAVFEGAAGTLRVR